MKKSEPCPPIPRRSGSASLLNTSSDPSKASIDVAVPLSVPTPPPLPTNFKSAFPNSSILRRVTPEPSKQFNNALVQLQLSGFVHGQFANKNATVPESPPPPANFQPTFPSSSAVRRGKYQPTKSYRQAVLEKNLSNSINTSQNSTEPFNELSEEAYFSEEYIAAWEITDNLADHRCQEFSYTVKRLSNVDPTNLFMAMPNVFKLEFRLISQGFIDSTKTSCSLDTRRKLISTAIDSGLISFCIKYYKSFAWEVMSTSNVWNYRETKEASGYLQVLTETIRLCCYYGTREQMKSIYDEFIDFLLDILSSRLILDVVSIPPNVVTGKYGVLMSLRMMLLTLSLFSKHLEGVREVLCSKQIEVLMSALLCSSPDYFMRTICSTINSYVRLKPGQLTDFLPGEVMIWQCTEGNLEKCLNDVISCINRIKSVTIEEMIQEPWRHFDDLRFLLTSVDAGRHCTNPENTRLEIIKTLLAHEIFQVCITYWRRVDQMFADVDENGESSVLDPIRSAYGNIKIILMIIVTVTEFCRKFLYLQQQIFDSFFHFLHKQLNDEKYLKSAKPFKQYSMFQEFYLLLTLMLSVMFNWASTLEKSVGIMRETNVLATVKQYRDVSTECEVKTSSLLILAYVLDESDDRSVMELKDVELSYLIIELEKAMLKKLYLSPQELIEGLNRIAVIDENKRKLSQHGYLPILVRSLNPKYPIKHQTAAVQGIWNLAFNEDCRIKIISEKGCLSGLKALATSEDEGLRGVVAGALWQLVGKNERVGSLSVEKKQQVDSGKHIMLSYNHSSKEHVYKIRDHLRSLGYRVWIDVDSITAGQSMLESMSNAIEGSFLVLLFFSEAYKNSVNCRAEAEYAFEMRKPILPVQVQSKYRPDGWLGFICGTKYRYTIVDPVKYQRDLASLSDKIAELAGSGAQHTSDDVKSGETHAPPKLASSVVNLLAEEPLACRRWTKSEVRGWLSQANLDAFTDKLADMDGEMLHELYQICQTSPEVFYSLISRLCGNDLVQVLKFSQSVKRLKSL